MRKYMGKTISPSWMDNLRNLVEIVFSGCKNCERIPPLGRLPCLRVIQLVDMHSLKYFHDDDINMSIDNTDMFICLQRLEISMCVKLISLPDNLPKLEDLELYSCVKLISLPCNLPSIRKINQLVIRGCKHLGKRCKRNTGEDWHKISHISDLSNDVPDLSDDDDLFYKTWRW
ncbi:putative leucine-rich repeat domain superfamily [Helianthus debilis subsp. tardiflorus]